MSCTQGRTQMTTLYSRNVSGKSGHTTAETLATTPSPGRSKRKASTPACSVDTTKRFMRRRPSDILAPAAMPPPCPTPQPVPTRRQIVLAIRRVVAVACTTHCGDRLATDTRFTSTDPAENTDNPIDDAPTLRTAQAKICPPSPTTASTGHAEEIQHARESGCRILVRVSTCIPVSTCTLAHAMLLWNVFLDARAELIAANSRPLDQRFAASADLLFLCPSTSFAHLVPSVPLACFQLACKTNETCAPRLQDLVGVANAYPGASDMPCSSSLLCEGENSVLSALRWDTCLTPFVHEVERLLDIQPSDSPTSPTPKESILILYAGCCKL